MKKIIFSTLIILIIFSSCSNKFPEQEIISPEETTMENLKASASFTWNNSNDTQITIFTKDNSNQSVPNVKVSVWTNFEEDGGAEIATGVTTNQGELNFNYTFESDMTEVVLKTNFLGFIPEVKVPIENGNIYYTFGGDRNSSKSQNYSKSNQNNYTRTKNPILSKSNTNMTINYLGNYNSSGVPDYLEPQGDYISGDFLQDINIAFPEYRPVPKYHPEYLMDRNEHNLLVLEEAEVWVTFVSEGAGYRNVLAYYTYDRDFPPQSPEDIKECTVIFPNASFAYSGGGLYSGDKVSLGVFPKGTVIGWILMRNGWNGSAATEGRGFLYSDLELNPEPNIEHKQHSVLLFDEERDVMLIAFEDLIRPGGDDDFNDAIFYATANPIENIEIGNVLVSKPVATDTDNDGINDSFDDYPENSEKAFNNYYPSNSFFGSLAFEDLWPSKGDYDFNDLVVDYNFNSITNADNKVVALEGQFVVRAIGASLENGFGFMLEGVNPSFIESVTGTEYTENYIQTNPNGTESGQSNATIIVFDNAKRHGFGNTLQNQTYQQADTLKVSIDFSTPVDREVFGSAPFNPFIIINKERGKEVHLADYAPTDLADTSLFGQASDDTRVNNRKYYKTVDNLPWALNFPSKFEYPIENASIDTAHLTFIDWVLSEGFNFKDWYKDEFNYRNKNNVYRE